MVKENSEVQRIMANLKCSKEEALDILTYDKQVDKAKSYETLTHDLPPDKQKIAQKYAHTGTRKAPTVFKFEKKNRKPNATKAGIIAELFKFLSENSEYDAQNVNIANKERQVDFIVGEYSYSLTLVQHRKPKN